MKRFYWGVATSAFQLEGSQYADWAFWDSRIHPNCNITNHYHLYKRDLQLLKELGVNAYRFSIEWSRIQPEENIWDKDVIRHYQEIIDFLNENDIEPFLTLHHFTHPVWFIKKFPWHEDKSIVKFTDFAKKIVERFKNVRYWIIFNEPYILLLGGYLDGCMPPGVKDLQLAIKALNNILTCYSKVYEIIHMNNSNAMVSLAHNMAVFDAWRKLNPLDCLMSKISTYFYNHSLLDAFLTGRLNLKFPFKKPVEIDIPIKGKIDFLGVNFYTRIHIKFNPLKRMMIEIIHRDTEGHGLTDLGWEVHPHGLEAVLKYASKLNVPIIITENGIATDNDKKKIKFIKHHIDVLEKCIKKGMDIRGYFYWSLMDNYEWLKGLNARFGLYKVDFQTLERKPTKAAFYYSHLIRSKKF